MDNFRKEFGKLFDDNIFIEMILLNNKVTIFVNNNCFSDELIECYNHYMNQMKFTMDSNIFNNKLYLKKNIMNPTFNNEVVPDFYTKEIMISNKHIYNPNASHAVMGINHTFDYKNCIKMVCAKNSNKIFLSNDITHLCLGDSYNSEINLPDSLEYLQFGNQFNKKVILPKNLKKLIFGYKYNKSIEELPDSLEYIYFGKKYNKQIFNIPKNLKYIKFGKEYIHHEIFTDLNNIIVDLDTM